ncbi:hypothetical protein KQ875_00790 [Mycoplasma zalophi]|uniref:Phosphatidylinositol-specific phospholipase C X domain-containing protein n=1 Tax=Mycoplasma zalophi TaxID=191287 RepID=A0ABS6DP85_9MOLU|nr:hypothetical protein [Mycoplasma zalophi]MBU4692135.1 hypothetical protein [Mycoplasma zalophi]
MYKKLLLLPLAVLPVFLLATATYNSNIDKTVYKKPNLATVTNTRVIANNYLATDWMKELPDTRPLSSLSLPGTHDSTMYNGYGFLYTFGGSLLATTQHFNFEDQLKIGIRAFDLRMQNDGRLVHGVIPSYQTLDDAFRFYADFLKKHPTEFLVVRIKDENFNVDKSYYAKQANEEYKKVVHSKYRNYVYNPEGKDVNEIARTKGFNIGQYRGKIIVLNHLHHKINTDNVGGFRYRTIVANETTQDRYDEINSSEEKVKYITQHFEKSSSKQYWDGRLFVNFTSYASGRRPDTSSPEVNQNVVNYINSHNSLTTLGLVFSDFPGPSLVQSIYRTNFNYTDYLLENGVLGDNVENLKFESIYEGDKKITLITNNNPSAYSNLNIEITINNQNIKYLTSSNFNSNKIVINLPDANLKHLQKIQVKTYKLTPDYNWFPQKTYNQKNAELTVETNEFIERQKELARIQEARKDFNLIKDNLQQQINILKNKNNVYQNLIEKMKNLIETHNNIVNSENASVLSIQNSKNSLQSFLNTLEYEKKKTQQNYEKQQRKQEFDNYNNSFYFSISPRNKANKLPSQITGKNLIKNSENSKYKISNISLVGDDDKGNIKITYTISDVNNEFRNVKNQTIQGFITNRDILIQNTKKRYQNALSDVETFLAKMKKPEYLGIKNRLNSQINFLVENEQENVSWYENSIDKIYEYIKSAKNDKNAKDQMIEKEKNDSNNQDNNQTEESDDKAPAEENTEETTKESDENTESSETENLNNTLIENENSQDSEESSDSTSNTENNEDSSENKSDTETSEDQENTEKETDSSTSSENNEESPTEKTNEKDQESNSENKDNEDLSETNDSGNGSDSSLEETDSTNKKESDSETTGTENGGDSFSKEVGSTNENESDLEAPAVPKNNDNSSCSVDNTEKETATNTDNEDNNLSETKESNNQNVNSDSITNNTKNDDSSNTKTNNESSNNKNKKDKGLETDKNSKNEKEKINKKESSHKNYLFFLLPLGLGIVSVFSWIIFRKKRSKK